MSLTPIMVPPVSADHIVKVVKATKVVKIAKVIKPKVVAPLVPANIMAKWRKVSICEEGGNWQVQGSIYSGGLGITNRNWKSFGGLQFAPNGGLATPEQQVVVAIRIATLIVGKDWVPDQNGCGHGW